MEKITFNNVLPQVFATIGCTHSDVWQNNVEFKRGKTYLVLADSGRGKSTFCSYVCGYRSDYSGDVCFDGKPTRAYSIRQWTEVRRREVSLLFQELRLFPELTAMENVEVKNSLTQHKTRRQIEEWFERLGIADKANEKISHMSFGQQQRVAMMRALAQPFTFLLADEPISHLDDNNARLMHHIMMEEARSQGAAVIVTSIGKHVDINYDETLKL